MSRKVIAFVNRKGGTGKTTSCAYLAMCLHAAGRQVTGLDADPDGSWLGWARGGVLPFEVIGVDSDKLKEAVEGLESYIVIDTPPNDPESIFDAAEVADEVIIPIAPTALDINRLVKTLSTVGKVERMRDKPLASVLLTKWNQSYVISREVEEALKEREAPLLEAKIRDLTRYTGFNKPSYLLEYEAVLEELGVL